MPPLPRDGVKYETQCIFDALIYKFEDIDTARNLVAIREQAGIACDELNDRLRLPDLVSEGNFPAIQSMLKGMIPSCLHEKFDKLVVIQSQRWLMHRQGNIITDFKSDNDLETAMEIGQILLKPSKLPENQLNHDIFRHLYRFLYKSHHLQYLLDSALHFKDLLEWGRKKSTKRADLRSFVYVNAYLGVSLPPILHPVDLLSKLAANVRTVNEFGNRDITERLSALLDMGMSDNALSTIEILRKHSAFANSMRAFTNWTPLGTLTRDLPAHFDYVSEYMKRDRNIQNPISVLDVGRRCAVALRRVGTDIFTPDSRSGIIFPVSITKKLDSEVWSVCSDCAGSYALLGTDKGDLYVFDFGNGSHVKLMNIYSDNNDEEVQRGTERIKAHPNQPGVFAVTGGGILTIVDVTARHKAVQYSVPSNSYGDISWHPENQDLIFYCNDTINKVYLMQCSKRKIFQKFDFDRPFMAMTNCGNSSIVLLTASVLEQPQSIVILDFNTNKRSAVRLHKPLDGGSYSTMICSQWDMCTIMLVSRPNMIILVDKFGKRPTKIIYGPKQEDFMIKAVFFGVMDKYILVTSEEKDNLPKAWLLNRFTGDRVGFLTGHSRQVNDVSFANHSQNPMMMTGGDDARVLFYSIKSVLA